MYELGKVTRGRLQRTAEDDIKNCLVVSLSPEEAIYIWPRNKRTEPLANRTRFYERLLVFHGLSSALGTNLFRPLQSASREVAEA